MSATSTPATHDEPATPDPYCVPDASGYIACGHCREAVKLATARAEGFAAGVEAAAALLVEDWTMPSTRAALAAAIRGLKP